MGPKLEWLVIGNRQQENVGRDGGAPSRFFADVPGTEMVKILEEFVNYQDNLVLVPNKLKFRRLGGFRFSCLLLIRIGNPGVTVEVGICDTLAPVAYGVGSGIQCKVAFRLHKGKGHWMKKLAVLNKEKKKRAEAEALESFLTQVNKHFAGYPGIEARAFK